MIKDCKDCKYFSKYELGSQKSHCHMHLSGDKMPKAPEFKRCDDFISKKVRRAKCCVSCVHLEDKSKVQSLCRLNGKVYLFNVCDFWEKDD